MRPIIPSIAIALIATACSPASGDKAADPAAKPPTEAEAGVIVDKVETSYTSGNAATIMANYAPDAVFFDLAVSEPTDDRATATKWTEGFVAMKPSNFSPGNRKIQVLDADTFITSGIAIFDTVMDAKPARMSLRYTDVYQKQADGSWQIVHEHLSLPPKPEAGAAQ